MSIPIEGFCVVVQKDRIADLLEAQVIEIPNAMAWGDDHLWRCAFMTKPDALEFIKHLESFELNASQGPDSDVVLVNEFDLEVEPYCEWLQMTRWEKAVIAWKVGTDPQALYAREGWDPKVGSGLEFHETPDLEQLEFVRLEGNLEVYQHKETGKEYYIGRTSTPVEAMFQTAANAVQQHFRNPGEPRLAGKAATEVKDAVVMLKEVVDKSADWWNPWWVLGKAQSALGDYEDAYESFTQAARIAPEVVAIPRELAGVCMETGRLAEAVQVAERAVALTPEDDGLVANLALAYLLDRRYEEAVRTITHALKVRPDDQINQTIERMISEVKSGARPQPMSLSDLSHPVPPAKKKQFWEFWK